MSWQHPRHALPRWLPWGSATFRITVVAFAWLAAISALHTWRNGVQPSGRVVRMGHMPVLSNLACPLLDAASRDRDPRYLALKFSSFAEMAESFRNRAIDVGFIIAPLPLVLRAQDVPARIVYIGNRHESTLVARRELGIGRGEIARLAGHTVAVPIRFSGHNLALRRALRAAGVPEGAVRIVEMPPPDMAAAVAAGQLDAYLVGEPFAARSLVAGQTNVVAYIEDLWPGFLCNVMIVHDDLIRDEPELVRRLVAGAVRSNAWAQSHRRPASQIAGRLWGQTPELLLAALDTPPGRVRFDLPVPVGSEIREMFEEMVRFGLMSREAEHTVDEVWNDSFARGVSLEGLTDEVESILPGS